MYKNTLPELRNTRSQRSAFGDVRVRCAYISFTICGVYLFNPGQSQHDLASVVRVNGVGSGFVAPEWISLQVDCLQILARHQMLQVCPLLQLIVIELQVHGSYDYAHYVTGPKHTHTRTAHMVSFLCNIHRLTQNSSSSTRCEMLRMRAIRFAARSSVVNLVCESNRTHYMYIYNRQLAEPSQICLCLIHHIQLCTCTYFLLYCFVLCTFFSEKVSRIH